jgi:hypothetical protein
MGKRCGKELDLEEHLQKQAEYYNAPAIDWDNIYFEWVAWGLPLEDFYNYPNHQIIKVWQGVKLAKAKEVNALSIATAQLTSMVYEYIRDHEKSSPRSIEEFLPYDLKSLEQSELIDKVTAEIIIEARDNGNLPPNILSNIVNVPGLYEAICLVGSKARINDGFTEIE